MILDDKIQTLFLNYSVSVSPTTIYLRRAFNVDINGDEFGEAIFAPCHATDSLTDHLKSRAFILGWVDEILTDLTDKWLPNDTNVFDGVGDLTFGDFNSDGKTDLFLTASADSQLNLFSSELKNDGNSFDITYFSNSIDQHGVLSHDINSDGFEDVVTFGWIDNNGELPIFTGGPHGLERMSSATETEPSTDPMANNGSSGVIDNFLGNGIPCLVTVDNGPEKNTKLFISVEKDGVFVGFSLAKILPEPIMNQSTTTKGHHVAVKSFDFSQDGLPDLIIFSRGWWDGEVWPIKSTVQFLQNEGDGNFVDVTDQRLFGYDLDTQSAYEPIIVDINKDGLLDIFISDSSYVVDNKSTSILLQQQNGTFFDSGRSVFNEVLNDDGGFGTIIQNLKGDWYFLSEHQENGGAVTIDVYPILFPERELSEYLSGTLYAESIYGCGGDDYIAGNGDNDLLDGGAGLDIAIYSGLFDDYSVNPLIGVVYDTLPNRDGIDTFVNIERLQFADKVVGLDVEKYGNTGEVYRLYLSVLGRKPEPVGCGFWIDKLDRGVLSAEQMVGSFLNSTEFVTRFGGTTNTNESFVNLLYLNLLGRDGHSDSGFSFWLNVLDKNVASREQVVVGFMESPENIANAAPLIGDTPTYQQWVG